MNSFSITLIILIILLIILIIIKYYETLNLEKNEKIPKGTEYEKKNELPYGWDLDGYDNKPFNTGKQMNGVNITSV